MAVACPRSRAVVTYNIDNNEGRVIANTTSAEGGDDDDLYSGNQRTIALGVPNLCIIK